MGADPYGHRTTSGVRHDQHHKSHNWRVGGVGKSQHGSDPHVPFQQLKDNSRVPPHSAKASKQLFHATSSEVSSGFSSSVVNTRVIPSKRYPTSISDLSPSERPQNISHQPDYYPPAAANEPLNDPGDRGSPSGASSPSSTPNSTLGKLHHLQMQQDALQGSHSDSRLLRTDSQSSGDSGTASLEASKSDIVLYQEGTSAPTQNGTTKIHMGNVSLSVQNALNLKHSGKTPGVGKEREKQSSLASVSNKYRPSGPMSSVSGDTVPPRVLQPPRSSMSSTVSARVAMFNQNLNNSGNSATSSGTSNSDQPSSLQGKQMESTSSRTKSSSKGVKTPSPKTITRSPEEGFSGEAGDAIEGGDERERQGGMDSRSSSIEELSQINVAENEENLDEGEDEVDAGRHKEQPSSATHHIIKPEATKSSQQQQQQQQHMGGYGKPLPQGPPPPSYPLSIPPPPAGLPQHSHHHPSHHHTVEPSHHAPPPPYPPYVYATGLSQGGLSQGGGSQVQGQQLSQGIPPNYQAYEQHYPGRSDVAVYPPPPPPPIGGKYGGRGGMVPYEGVPRQHHHISPPHSSQQYEQQQAQQHQAGYATAPPSTQQQQQQPKHQSVGYQMSHDSRPGAHMMSGGQQLPPHISSHDIPLHHRTVPYLMSGNVVAVAHDAAGKGDINVLVSVYATMVYGQLYVHVPCLVLVVRVLYFSLSQRHL